MKYVLEGNESERLTFRKIQESDSPIWLEFFKDPRSYEHWIEERKTPEIECAKWYEKQFNRYKNDKGGMNALIEKKTGKLVGHCGLLVQTVDGMTELENGYSLLPEFWSNGYAVEAARYCRDFAFKNNFADSIISIISITNSSSEKVALKNGMTIDKPTVYNGNRVNIFRIHKDDWKMSTLI